MGRAVGIDLGTTNLGTGHEQSITITGGSALTQEEIERMVRDAEAHAEEDRRRRELIEIRNEAEKQIYRAETLLRDSVEAVHCGRASPMMKGEVEDALTELRTATEDDDAAAIRAALDRLGAAAKKFGTSLYGSPHPGFGRAEIVDEDVS